MSQQKRLLPQIFRLELARWSLAYCCSPFWFFSNKKFTEKL